MKSTGPRLKYRKGLLIDQSKWEIVRDTYSLLDPAHLIPRSPRFAFNPEPFLILLDRFGRRGLKAGIQRTAEGRKTWWLSWHRDGEEQMVMCVDSLQVLLYYLDESLYEVKLKATRHPRRKRG